MRTLLRLLILILLFGGGLIWGLMYNPINEQGIGQGTIDVENLIEKEEPVEEVMIIDSIEREKMKDHPVEKFATLFESLTVTFFEKIITLLYKLSESFF